MTVLPISTSGPGKELQNALMEMMCRAVKLSKKRPSPMGLEIPICSIEIIAVFDRFYNGKYTVEEACNEINKIMV